MTMEANYNLFYETTQLKFNTQIKTDEMLLFDDKN